MKKFYIKAKIYYTDKKQIERKNTWFSGIYQTPYMNDCKENDIYLIGKLLKSFVTNDEIAEKDIVIYSIDLGDIHEVHLYD